MNLNVLSVFEVKSTIWKIRMFLDSIFKLNFKNFRNLTPWNIWSPNIMWLTFGKIGIFDQKINIFPWKVDFWSTNEDFFQGNIYFLSKKWGIFTVLVFIHVADSSVLYLFQCSHVYIQSQAQSDIFSIWSLHVFNYKKCLF